MAEDNTPKVVCDPGWNDPPLFSYESHKNHVKKTSLNKRINYSLEGVADSHKSTTVVDSDGEIVPPTSSPPISMGPPSISVPPSSIIPPIKLAPCNESIAPETVDLTVILNKIQLTIDGLYNDENEKEVHEIKRRLKLMEKMWNEDKFPNDVKQKLGIISEALQENDLVACDNLQRSLMVDYTSLCSSWMAAIRLLINSKRKFCANQNEN